MLVHFQKYRVSNFLKAVSEEKPCTRPKKATTSAKSQRIRYRKEIYHAKSVISTTTKTVERDHAELA